jgi:uncharacterized membrane protein YkoI
MAKTTEKAILGVLVVLALGIGSVLVAAHNPFGFTSSIQTDDANEVDDALESEESAKLAPLAKITSEEAVGIARGAVDQTQVGEMTDVELENEDGNVVYAVEFTKEGFETDVKIDAGNGHILLIEDDSTELDSDDEGDEED